MVDGREAYERLRTWGEEPGSVALLTDIDGTLAPIVPTPDMSEISDEIRDSLQRLSRECLLVAAISGRKTEDALGLLGLEDVVYFGNHGFEILRDGQVEVIPEALPYLERVEELEQLAREELAPGGPFVEEKGVTASVHYGGLLEWDMWARIDRNRLARLLKYASIRIQIRLSRVAIGPPPRHQQTTARTGSLCPTVLNLHVHHDRALGISHGLPLGRGHVAANPLGRLLRAIRLDA